MSERAAQWRNEAESVNVSIDTTEPFLALDALIARFDADAESPLRKGEEPFRWSAVETQARALMAMGNDLRVAIWLLRALIAKSGMDGLSEGLGLIAAMLKCPPSTVSPLPEPGEPPRDAHAIPLGWLGGEAFLALVTTQWPDGEAMNLSGFMAVDEKRLADLSRMELSELHRNNSLSLLSFHQLSLNNLSLIVERKWQAHRREKKAAAGTYLDRTAAVWREAKSRR